MTFGAVTGLLRRAGYELHPASLGPITMERALAHFSSRFEIATVIDVGASNGCWTELALRHWPKASYLLVEAQRNPHEPALRRLRSRVPQVEYVLAAAGARTGTIHFDASDPFAGRASDRPVEHCDIEVPVTTLDHEVEQRRLRGPYLVKLDTHGFEVQILEGARRVLAESALLVVESYNFTLCDGALRFPDLCDHLERAGFLPIGIVDAMYRPKDGALWQLDCFFARSDRPEFRDNRYA
jgi:FkbM family methyltransferase